MTRPNDIPEGVWATANDVRSRVFNAMHDDDGRLTDNDPAEIVARAILAERERCAAIADAYADENIAMAGDTILMDPILSRRPSDGPVTVQELERSEDLMVGGTIHSSMFHAAQNIAAAIRSGA